MPSEVNEAIMALLNNDIVWDDFSNDIVDCLKGNLASTKYELKGRRIDYESKSYTMKLDFCRIRSEGVCVTKSQTTKLRAKIMLFVNEYICLLHRFLTRGMQVQEIQLPSQVMDLDVIFIPRGKIEVETLYYIAGYLAQSARKEATRRTGNMKLHLHYSSDVASIENIPGSIAPQSPNLPTAKVDCLSAYGGLIYSSPAFFEVVSRIEEVFKTFLTTMNLMLHGSLFINMISIKLEETPVIYNEIKALLPNNAGEEDAKNVMKYILQTYTRMRGKDYVRCLMSRAKKSVHVARRKALATKSEEARKRALEKKLPMSANVNTAHESTETEMETSEEYCAMQFLFDAMEGEAMFEYDHLH
jgi:hypothetical protein